MSLNTGPYEAAIVARIKTVCPRVVITEVPDGEPTPAYPYVLVRWIEPIRLGSGGHHIDGSQNDAQRAGAIVTVVSTDDVSANAVKNRIRPLLAGYRPPDCDEIKFEGGLSYSRSNTTPKPTTYAREMYCSWITNLSWND